MNDKLWAADPHQYGHGKIHIVDDSDEKKTLCGRFTSAIPGKRSDASKPTCRVCLDATVRRPESERMRAEYERQRLEREAQKAEENEKWWAWYDEYLKSSQWRAVRRRVLDRSGGLCEGCLHEQATEVHHTTYAHVGHEFMWELRAICRTCHDRITLLDRERRAVR